MVVIADVAAMIEDNDVAGVLSRPRQSSLLFTRSTTTTEQQLLTELECEPYLNLTTAVDTSKTDQLEYFINRGLIYKTNDANNDDDDETNEYSVRLLRDAHAEYLYTVFRDEPQKLRPSFVSLDSSHTWMIYWCLHGLDLMGKFQQTAEDYDHSHTMNNSQRHLTQRIIRTIQSCYTTMETVSIARDVVQSDPILSHLMPPPPPQLDDADDNNDTTRNEDVTFHNIAGGFGGGPHQLPHAATTYAAIMSLCILAASSSSSSCVTLNENHDDHDGDNEHKNLALEYLSSIRTSLYVFFATLYNPANGSFRMHVDGEMDVRATYCVFSVLRLLRMMPHTSDKKLTKASLFTNPCIADYIWSCQSTWEGGFGGEPGAEAHGGYTYCAVAALYLFREGRGIPCTSDIATKTTSQHATRNREAVRLERCLCWVRQRQMCYEGGFSGRINKLVDGCYSFWQGAASVILQQQKEYPTDNTADSTISDGVDGFFDPWIAPKLPGVTTYPSQDKGSEEKSSTIPQLHYDPFNALMLERYILLCAQDENGGLRDKPSKGRDFYHSCYCLSGLSIVQQYGGNNISCHRKDNRIHRTHPCYNIRIEYVALCQSYFGEFSVVTTPNRKGT